MDHITLFSFNCPKASSSTRLDANNWEWVINSPRGTKQQIFWITQSSSAIGNSTAVFLFNFSSTTNIFNTMGVDLFLLCLFTCLLIPVNQEGPPSCLTFWNIVSSSLSLLLQTSQSLMVSLRQFPNWFLCHQPVSLHVHAPHPSWQSPAEGLNHSGLLRTFLIWAPFSL